MSGREQAAPGQEGEERPGPLWEGGLHRGFQSALRAISKEAKGDEKWAAVSAEPEGSEEQEEEKYPPHLKLIHEADRAADRL